MSHQAPPPSALSGTDPGRPVAQLREAVRLVAGLAGNDPDDDRERQLDEAARVSDAYHRAPPIVQHRFDALAGETLGWTAAGVEALIGAALAAPRRAAAARLAARIETAIDELTKLIDQPAS